MILGSSQSAGSFFTMKTKTFFAIVVCSCLLLVHGVDLTKTADSKNLTNAQLANPAEFRFVVRMALSQNIGRIVCGGSVITNRYILTTAHCIYQNDCRSLVGFPSAWVKGDAPNFHIYWCFLHEEADGRDYYYDFGLARSREDLYSQGYHKIKFPPPGTLYKPGKEAVIVGWQRVVNGTQSHNFMRAKLQVYSFNKCNRAYQVAKQCVDNMVCAFQEIPDHVFCTLGQPSAYPGPCLGDIGGPVIIDGYLAGVKTGLILNDSLKCQAEKPGLNTDLSQFSRWFKEFFS